MTPTRFSPHLAVFARASALSYKLIRFIQSRSLELNPEHYMWIDKIAVKARIEIQITFGI